MTRASIDRFAFPNRAPLLAHIVAIACATTSFVLIASPVEAQDIRARYTLRYIDIPVGSVSTFGQVSGGTYRAGLDGQQSEYLAVLSSFRANMRSDGVVRKGEVLPRTYAATEITGGVTYRSEIKFEARNAVAVDTQPALKDANERVPVETEHTLNVMDPSSALLMTVPEGAPTVGPAACDRTLRVFSGTHRSDIALSYLRVERMDSAAYKGQVTVCSARLVAHAGYRPRAYMTRFMAENRNIVVKLAPVADSRFVVLAGVTAPLPLGTFAVNLEELAVSP